MTAEFYAGMLSALIVLSNFDEPTIFDAIVDTLGRDEIKGLIRYSQKNEEFVLSGMKAYTERHSDILR